jgi:LPS O-antigen subunit length determinant protein (WzzB/FepE family)
MTKLVRWAGRLYPSAWRRRYGAEFDALLEEAAPGSGDLWDVLRGAFVMRIVRLSFPTVIAACMVLGALIAGAGLLVMPISYQSTAMVRAELAKPTTRVEMMIALQRAQQVALSRTSLAQIIMREDLYPKERATMPLNDVINTMKIRDIRIRVLEGDDRSTKITVQFLYPEAARAQRTVQELVAALQRPMSAEGKLEVLDAASLPQAPIAPAYRTFIGGGAAIGMLFGLLGSAIFALVRRRKEWSLKRVGAFALAGMIAGLAVAMLIPNEYVSSAVIRSTDVQGAPRWDKVLTDELFAGIIQREGLYQRERAQSSMTDVVSRMKNKFVRVQKVEMAGAGWLGPGTVEVISFRGGDRMQAQRVTRSLVTAWIQSNVDSATKVEVLDPPSDPTRPFSPNRPQIAWLGMMGGLLLGFALVRFRGRVSVA